jgi:hypothetical protein
LTNDGREVTQPLTEVIRVDRRKFFENLPEISLDFFTFFFSVLEFSTTILCFFFVFVYFQSSFVKAQPE